MKRKVYEEPAHRFPVIVRDRSHFTAMISILNKNCKSGMQNWTMTKKVGKHLRKSNSTPVETEVLIFNEDVNTAELETLIKLL